MPDLGPDIGPDVGPDSAPAPDASSVAAPPLPVLAIIAVTIPYTPNPLTAALQITEASMDEGAYPCAVSGPAADGITYTLTANLTSLPAGLGPGDVSVLPGDIVGGVFSAAAVNGIQVAPSLGTLTLAGAAPAAALDLDLTCGPALTQIGEAGHLLLAGADGFLHLRLSATDSALAAPVDLSVYPVEMAAVPTYPLSSDWLPAAWLLRAAAPAGLYATLAAGPDSGLALGPGAYWLYARVTVLGEVYELKSSAPLLVRN